MGLELAGGRKKVRVGRASEAILATLDQEGMLDRLPFMPEMLKYCGRQFAVYKRAEKVLNVQDEKTGARRVMHAII